MMRVILWLLFITSSALALENYPVGVNLGFKFITAARFTGENKLELLAKIEGSEDYQSHIRKLASHSQERKFKFGEVYLRDESGRLVPAPIEYHGYQRKDEDTIDQALRELSSDLSQKLGYLPTITSITIPRGLDYIAKHHMYDTLCDGDSIPQVSQPWQVLGFLDATRSAYDLDNTEGPEPKVPRNIYHDHDFLVLYVDYNAYSLDFWVATIAEFTAGLVGDEPPFSFRHQDLAASYGNDDDSKTKQSRVENAIQQLLADLFSREEAEDLNVIILSGEASPKSMDSLGQTIRKMVPRTWQGIIRDQLDPNFVTAIGAAHRARKFIQRPELWKVQNSHTHDEL